MNEALYENLSFFIALGEGASEIVEEIMIAIAVHGINQPMELSFSGDDDGPVGVRPIHFGPCLLEANNSIRMWLFGASLRNELAIVLRLSS